MSLYQLHDLRLQELIRWIDSGKMRLPEFQRSFRWPLASQRELLDSIQKGFPVGTLLLMEVDPEVLTPFGSRQFDSTSSAPTDELRYLVLDGQQRLSSCYGALLSELTPRVFALDLKALFERVGLKSGLSVDFSSLLVTRNRPEFLEKLLFNSHLLPMSFLTDKSALRVRLATYREQLAKSPPTADLSRFVDLHLQSYLDVFFDYAFPCVVLPHDLDMEAVCNVFTKINSTGLRLSAFDLCVSTLFPQHVNLREMLMTARSTESFNAVDTDGTNTLQTVALLSGRPPKKAGLPKNVTADDVKNRWAPAVAALVRTAELLRALGMWQYGSIPYDALVPAIAAALPSKKMAPPELEAMRQKIGRAVYQSALALRYTEGTDAKQSADFPAIRAWLSAGGEIPAFLAEPVVWSKSLVDLGDSGARYRAIIASLNEAAPHDFMTQDMVGYGPGRKPSELHHLFPRAYLGGLGRIREANRAFNFTFLTQETNIFIADRPPSTYVRELVTRRAANDNVSDAEAEKRVKLLLVEHMIDDKGWQALMVDDYERFLESRAEVFRVRLTNRFGVHSIRTTSPEDEQDSESDTDEP